MARRDCAYNVRVTFTLSDGRELAYCYSYIASPGADRAEDEYSEGHLELDRREVDESELPKGLAVIAELMQSDPCSFHSTQTRNFADYD